MVNQLYTEHVCKQGKRFLLVLEGDANTYEIIQNLKEEYDKDLNWLYAYPGDWHLLKNYQHCLMKPFFEAGLKQLADYVGYPFQSIQSCSIFKRTHNFLMETWESMYRHMIKLFLNYGASTVELQCPKDITQEVLSTFKQLTHKRYDHKAIACVVKSLDEQLEGLTGDFSAFVSHMSSTDDTWAFWSGFVLTECVPYVFSIRSGNWKLRMGAIKSMAANFTAYDHQTYQELILNHTKDVLRMPSELLDYFEKGGFTVSLSGKYYHSVGIDEAHEMLINKHTKQAIVRPSKEYIDRMAKYIPHRLDRFKAEILHISEQKDVHPTLPSILSTDHRTKKQEQNIIKVMTKVKELLPNLDQTSSNHGLINIFSERVANSAQRHDLLNFHTIGQTAFDNRINVYVLKVPSTTAPQRKKKLQTFSTTKTKGNNKLKSLKQEMLRVQKCIRRKIAFANKTGTMPDVIGEQYIEQPRALCNENSVPLNGQKSSVTKFYQSRYKGSTLITRTQNSEWVPDSVIIEGMFIINTKPLTSHKTMAIKLWGIFDPEVHLTSFFWRGSTQVHVLFDNPGQLEENPKVFEQARRDSGCTSVEHLCWILFDEAEVPKK